LTEQGFLPRARHWAWHGAALLWLVLVLAVAMHQWRFWHDPAGLDANVMSLLPADEQAPEVSLATHQLADQAARQIIVMLGTPDWNHTQQAALAWTRALRDQQVLVESRAFNPAAYGDTLAFYRPWRDRLLTPAQRAQLQETPPATLAQNALAALYQPAVQARLTDWVSDPLGLWTSWWTARAAETRARPRPGEHGEWLWLSAEGREWVVLAYDIRGSAFTLDGQAAFGATLARAEDAARQALAQTSPDATLDLLRAGIPLHAEAAAVQAHREINTIGWGSLAAVLLLVWLAFRSPRPIVLVALSLGIGCAVALSVTAWVFGSVHLLTLIFGASLVGVAEDYGIHYYASRQGQPWATPRGLMRQLLPGLLLALATSVLAYLALGLAPFPGLRQMALFSSVGLVAAMLTVVCWFPLLDRGTVHPNRFAQTVGASLVHWPRLDWPLLHGRRTSLPTPSRRDTRRAWALYALLGALCIAGLTGLWRLQTNDDVRQLQSSPPELMQSQIRLGRLLGVASPAQFYLVQGTDAEQVLQREEALTARLDTLARRHGLAYSALSDWVPSTARQRADAALTAQAEGQALGMVGRALGESLQRPAFPEEPLTVARWLDSPASAAARPLWLGELKGAASPTQASVVLLRGLHDTTLLPELAAAADGLPGVRWVDKAGEITALLGRYRVAMGLLLLIAHAAVFAALAWRFGRSAWRAWLPTALGSVITLALLGLLGQPLQLFNVLALLLLLGVGVDYGIFLLEHPNDGSAWLAVSLGAASTWLAFGLLGLSSTPALRAFGLTLLFGVAIVGLLAPCLRPAPGTSARAS
jgi:predicted exporter